MTDPSSDTDRSGSGSYHPLYWDTIDTNSFLVLTSSPDRAPACFETALAEAWDEPHIGDSVDERTTAKLADSWPIQGEPKRWVRDVFDEQVQYLYDAAATVQETIDTESAASLVRGDFNANPINRLEKNAGWHVRVYDTRSGFGVYGLRTEAELESAFQAMDSIVKIDLITAGGQPGDDLEPRTWKILGDDRVEGFDQGYAGPTPDDKLLTELLEDWSRGVRVEEWSDRRVFAGICFRESTMTLDDIATMTGLSPAEIQRVSVPEGPPWELDDPNGSGTMRISKKMGNHP